MEARAATAIAASVDADARARLPHDLLRLRRLPFADDEPAWLRDAWARAPFAVVRRAPARAGFVAVGVRGAGRAQRYGTWAALDEIERRIAPEQLLDEALSVDRSALPAFVALARLRREASCLRRFAWGPTGSAGFELATGCATVTASSDLDLLIRAPRPLSHADALQIFDALQNAARHAGTRIDAQLDTPAGGVALAEYAAGKPRVLARDADGPRLIDDPWHTVVRSTA